MKTVTIYTTMTCPFCYKAKGLLKKKGIDFKEISVDLNSKLRAEISSGKRREEPLLLIVQ